MSHLHHEITGSGPVLLLLPGGDGDSRAYPELVSRLEGSFTIVTYDRRGLSRSRIGDDESAPDVDGHADDAARLLEAVGGGPAFVFGSSMGGMIGLSLLSRYPHLVSRLVAHEPPAQQFLPPDAQQRANTAMEAVEAAYETSGVGEALRDFTKLVSIDPEDREPDVPPAPVGLRRLKNLKFFLAHDVRAVRLHTFDLGLLTAVADRIRPAAGASEPERFAHRCAVSLATALNIPVTLFPGGHTSPALRPTAVSALLKGLLLEAG